MKVLSIIMVLFLSTVASAQEPKSIYDFKVKTIDGKEFSMAELKGKKVLIVNTASKCGYTPQYAALQELYEKYGGEDFTIIGFPANNFMNQEPGTNEEIKTFCEVNYGITFPMMGKVSVKGKDIDPLYLWLTDKDENGKMDAKVKWNFQKFMINEDGSLAGVVPPGESPTGGIIINWVKKDK